MTWATTATRPRRLRSAPTTCPHYCHRHLGHTVSLLRCNNISFKDEGNSLVANYVFEIREVVKNMHNVWICEFKNRAGCSFVSCGMCIARNSRL